MVLRPPKIVSAPASLVDLLQKKASELTPAEAAQLALAREQTMDSYLSYCTMAVARMGYAPAEHHRLIIEAIDDCMNHRGPARLLLVLPPGSAKSTYGTQLAPGYFFYHTPHGKMIGGSHTQDKADEFSLQAMGFIKDNRIELAYEIGGQFSREAARSWGTTIGGKYRAIGVGKKIAGERGDFVFLDDPVGNFEDVDTVEKRDKLWKWFWGELRGRLRPGGRIVLIMTRWHEDDIAGRLLKAAKPGEWRVLHIKAEAGEDDVLGRKPGEMLWGGQAGYDYAAELRAIKEEFEAAGQMSLWEAQFQGNPSTPGGALFRIDQMGVVEADPAGYQWVRAWDLAASEGKGDYTVGLKLGLGPDRRLCVGNIVRFRGGPAEVVRTIRATAERDGIGCMVSLPKDPGQAGVAQIAYLTRELLGFNVKASPESGDKTVRAMPAAAQMNAGNMSMVRNVKWNATFLDELETFPTGTYDDQVDALSRGVGELIQPAQPARAVRLSFMER